MLILYNVVGIGSIIKIIKMQDIEIKGTFENLGYLTLLIIKIDVMIENINAK